MTADFIPISFGAPPDPAYLRFLQGLEEVAADPRGKTDWKWRPADGKWYRYDISAWAMEDLGIADTPAGVALRGEGWPSQWEVVTLFVPSLFRKIQETHAELAKRFPGKSLVWSGMGGGSWRNAYRKAPAPPPPPPGHSKLPPDCVQRIERVRLFEQGGYITHDEAQKMISKIVEDCS